MTEPLPPDAARRAAASDPDAAPVDAVRADAAQADALEAHAERHTGGPAFRAHPTHWVAQDEHRLRAQALLRSVPLFSEVPPHHLRELARYTRTETFAAGETVIRMGEPGATMYLIRSGRVNVVREQPSGATVVLASLGPGEFFGELSIFDGETRSATVLAVEDTEALTLGRFDIVEIVRRSPEIALSLLSSLGARLRAANARLDDSSRSAPPS